MRSTLVLCLLLMLCGCASEPRATSTNVFRFNIPSQLTSLDPAFAKDQAGCWVANQLYNCLLQVDEGLNIRPSLAKSWEVSEDRLTFTFHLRTDVYFHDHELFANGKGRQLTAHDVAYSFRRIVDAATRSPGAWIFSDKISRTNSFKALNDSTFQLKLLRPFQPIMGILSHQYTSIVAREIVEHYGAEYRKNPVGTGPFMLKKWQEGEALILVKNPNYWEKDEMGEDLPYLDGMRISFTENEAAVYRSLMDGKLDLMSGVDPNYIDEVLTAEGELQPALKDRFRLEKSPYLNSEYLGFLLDKERNPVLADRKIRQAINYGFDRKKMMSYLRNNIGIPATAGFVPPGLPSFDARKVVGYPYQPQKSLALLQEAGYPNGEGLPEIKLETTSSYLDLCTFIQKQLEEVGIKVRIETGPPAQLREKMVKGESNFFRGSWIADYPDAESFLTIFYGGYPAPPNYTRFKNAKFDSLYQAGLTEMNNEKRFALYQQMDQLMIDEAPIVPLYYDEVLRFIPHYVKGLENNAFNLLDLRRVRMKKRE